MKARVRYYYWLIIVFAQKHFRLILVSFLISFITIVALISLSPYVETFFVSKKTVYGIIGKYDYNNIPEEIISKISNGLLYVNEKGSLVPILVNSWEIKDGGKQYRLHLRNDLYWSNGKKLLAEDIVSQFRNIKTKITDDFIIDFFLDKPLAIFPTYLQKPLIKSPLIGVAGLYKISQIKTKFGYITELRLEPNKTNLNPVIYKFYNDEAQLVAAYKKAEVNSITVNKKSIADTFKNWKNSSVGRSVDYSKLMTLFINFSNEKLKEKEIREALNNAINYDYLTENGEVAVGPVQPTSWAYNQNLKRSTFDIELAKKIFKKEVPASQSAVLKLVTYYEYYDIADEMKKTFDSAGISADIQMASPDKTPDFDLLLAYWKVPADPDQYYFWHSTQKLGNIGNYKNVKIDKLLEDGRNTLNLGDRKKIYSDFQRVILDDPPALFLYYPYVYTIKRV